MLTVLDPTTESVVRAVWARRLGVAAEAFRANELVLVERSGLTAVVVVRLGGATVEPHGPTLVGAASLSFADDRSMSALVGGEVRHPAQIEVDTVLSGCSDDESEESGLADMMVRFLVRGREGRPAAVAGYADWTVHWPT